METVKQLNKQEFTTKVADIEKSKGEWKFLGERPAVIDFSRPGAVLARHWPLCSTSWRPITNIRTGSIL